MNKLVVNDIRIKPAMSSRELAQLVGRRHGHTLKELRNKIERGTINQEDIRVEQIPDSRGRYGGVNYHLSPKVTLTFIMAYTGKAQNVVLTEIAKLWGEYLLENAPEDAL